MSSPLNHVYHNEEDRYAPSPCISPPRSSRRTSPSSTPPRPSRKHNHAKSNPYATRGLDKFTALKADLEQKKQRIYSQDGSQNISMVRFAYSNSSDNVVPIVVKTIDQNQSLSKQSSFSFDNKFLVEPESTPSSSSSVKEMTEPEKKTACWENRLGYFNAPSYYVPAVLIFILVLLTFLGKAVAVLFTCLGWYSLPSLMGDSLRKKKIRYYRMKKQDHLTKLEEKKMVISGSDPLKKKELLSSENPSLIGGVTQTKEPLHAHRKSW